MRNLIAAVSIVAAAGQALNAAEVTFGFGSEISTPNDREDASLSLDITSDPIWSLGALPIRLGAAVEVQDFGDAWIGLGTQLNVPTGERGRIDLSLHAGYYSAGSDHDLGYDVEFRTRIGYLFFLKNGIGLGIALQHISNARLGDLNPGVEALHLTVTHDF